MIHQRKRCYQVSTHLYQYLTHFNRRVDIPLIYTDLFRFTGSVPYENPDGQETLWLSVMYPPEVRADLYPALTYIYAMLKIGDTTITDHLIVDRVDYGEFGNSRPFRIRITNQFNGNSDYYYVKNADASRLYGLELEHLLSPFRINYIINGNTLIEEHIAGVPGDVFIKKHLPSPDLNPVRVAKEVVKFAERCYLRLLGDMRSVNYVVEITPDFEETQYRVRPIDFDQQSYEGRLEVYRPHLFQDNQPAEQLVRTYLNDQTIRQYRQEERTQMTRRAATEIRRLKALVRSMVRDELAPPSHLKTLSQELNTYHKTTSFNACRSMGALTLLHTRLQLGVNVDL